MDNRIFIRKMGHHFLFQEGSWNASGFYRDGEGNTVQLSGMTTIEHQDDLWVNEGFMEIEGDTPVRIRNRYEIIPFERGSDSTTWRSENPPLVPLSVPLQSWEIRSCPPSGPLTASITARNTSRASTPTLTPTGEC